MEGAIGGLVLADHLAAVVDAYGPTRGEYSHSPASLEGGHAVAVVAIAGAVYLALAGKVLDAEAVAVALVIIVFLKSTPAG